jgi:hypothetical protein
MMKSWSGNGRDVASGCRFHGVTLGLAFTLAVLVEAGLVSGVRPARAYDLHFRQNHSSFSGEELRQVFDRALPSAYDQTFADRQWSTWLLVDVHPEKGLAAITLGLCPRLSATSAALPVATMSFLEPWPANKFQQQQLLSQLAQRYATMMLENRPNISLPPRN